jgi:hypothetical protein
MFAISVPATDHAFYSLSVSNFDTVQKVQFHTSHSGLQKSFFLGESSEGVVSSSSLRPFDGDSAVKATFFLRYRLLFNRDINHAIYACLYAIKVIPKPLPSSHKQKRKSTHFSRR